MSKNNENTVAESIVSAIRAASPVNWTKAQTLATEHGLKPRSVVQVCVRHCIPYEKQGRVSKTGAPIARKPELVTGIAENLGLEVSALEGLEKASKEALQALLAWASEYAAGGEENEEDNEGGFVDEYQEGFGDEENEEDEG